MLFMSAWGELPFRGVVTLMEMELYKVHQGAKLGRYWPGKSGRFSKIVVHPT